MPEIRKEALDMVLASFMDAAIKWAIVAAKGRDNYFDAYKEGLEWGCAFGIYTTLENLGIIDKETMRELDAVLFSRKEE